MNKYIIISLLATLPLFTLAGENDSLSTMYSDSTSLLADSTDSVNDVADLETIEEVVVLENCDNAIYL
ncbi:MAG: hypothetical protein ACJAUF_000707 [Bacteroidia bacterium]|jgi:hypothetical protein